jgi:general secretion pathway protein N
VFDSTGGRVELELPVGAPIDQLPGRPGAGAAPAEASSIPNELPGEDESHPLQPPGDEQGDGDLQNPAEPGSTGDDGDDDDQDSGSSSGGASPQALRGGGPARMEMSNQARQAERLRQLRAAIQQRRAEQAAAKANEGDR